MAFMSEPWMGWVNSELLEPGELELLYEVLCPASNANFDILRA